MIKNRTIHTQTKDFKCNAIKGLINCVCERKRDCVWVAVVWNVRKKERGKKYTHKKKTEKNIWKDRERERDRGEKIGKNREKRSETERKKEWGEKKIKTERERK